jgi:hypothetical protein
MLDVGDRRDELAGNFTSLCDAIGGSYITANSATDEMLFKLNLACP